MWWSSSSCNYVNEDDIDCQEFMFDKGRDVVYLQINKGLPIRTTMSMLCCQVSSLITLQILNPPYSEHSSASMCIKTSN